MSVRKHLKLAPINPVQLQPAVLDQLPPGLSTEAEIVVDGERLKIHARELETLAEIGRGQYGRVERMLHRPSQRVFAVKWIALYQEHTNRAQIQKDLSVGQNTTCPCVVMCYGGLLHDSEVLVLMELMDISLEMLRTKVYVTDQVIPEHNLAYIVHRVVTGLEYLRSQLRIMHRDVKPSNMLANREGLVKVCDFGISGDLVKSSAPTNVGTNRYLAPERINPKPDQAYRIQSDVWSLGLSVIELATGELCYKDMDNVFQQLEAVVQNDPPQLPANDRFSDEIREFTSKCLVKDFTERASYLDLLNTPFLMSVDIEVGQKSLSYFLAPFLDF